MKGRSHGAISLPPTLRKVREGWGTRRTWGTRHDKLNVSAASQPTLAKSARVGHPQFRYGKDKHQDRERLGHPPYGLNAIGLERRGFTKERIRKIHHAYRLLLASKLNTSQALEKLKAETDRGDDVEMLIRFIEESERGVIK